MAKTAAQFKVPRRSIGGRFGIWGRDQFEWSDLELSGGHRVPRPDAGGSPREDGPNKNPPLNHFVVLAIYPHPSTKELQQVKPGGARDE